MLKGKKVAIISLNCLISLGLKLVLNNYFSPESVFIYFDFETYIAKSGSVHPDFIFIPSNLYVLFNEHFKAIKSRLIILLESPNYSLPLNASIATVDVTLSNVEMVERLEKIFYYRIKCVSTLKQGDLSTREIDVLKYIALGFMNKQIADQLSISLHTVVSHRKNIIRKLAINTISGLTVYALLQGIISSDDLNSTNNSLS